MTTGRRGARKDELNDRAAWLLAWRDVAGLACRQWEGWTTSRVMRRPSPDLIYGYFAVELARLESDNRKVDVTRIRAWAEDLLMGESGGAAPPGSIALRLGRSDALWVDFERVSVDLRRPDARAVFLALALGADNGVGLRDHASAVRDLYRFGATREDPPISLRAAVVRTALDDLSDGLRIESDPITSIALDALGWPAPWRPNLGDIGRGSDPDGG